MCFFILFVRSTCFTLNRPNWTNRRPYYAICVVLLCSKFYWMNLCGAGVDFTFFFLIGNSIFCCCCCCWYGMVSCSIPNTHVWCATYVVYQMRWARAMSKCEYSDGTVVCECVHEPRASEVDSHERVNFGLTKTNMYSPQQSCRELWESAIRWRITFYIHLSFSMLVWSWMVWCRCRYLNIYSVTFNTPMGSITFTSIMFRPPSRARMRYVRRMHMCLQRKRTLYPRSHVHMKAYLSTRHTYECREWCKAIIPRPLAPRSGSTIANRLGSRYTLLRNSIVLFISRAGRVSLGCFGSMLFAV